MQKLTTNYKITKLYKKMKTVASTTHQLPKWSRINIPEIHTK